MLDHFVSRPATRARWSSGPLSAHLDAYAAHLLERGLKSTSIAVRLRAVIAFGRWLSARRLSDADVDDRLVERYRESTRSEETGRVGKTALGLRGFLELLRARGGGGAADSSSASQAERFLDEYFRHLETARGLARSTCRVRLRFARRFLAQRFGTGPLEWSAITADDVVAFVRKEVSGRTGHGVTGPAASLRVLLRFLCQRGLVRDGLDGAVPRVRAYTHAHLPARLTPDEVDRAIAVWAAAADEASLRNRAILLLLARLGLRAQEVRHLHLEDVDWAEGRLLVRAGKTHSERSLPLTEEVGSALAGYLRDGRPPSRSRHLFLTLRPPRGPIQDSCVISRIVRRSLERAGIPPCGRAAHSLRHTVASQMVSAGAAFKDVADVLGHRSLATTEVYAKLDVAALSRIALPWPGGAR